MAEQPRAADLVAWDLSIYRPRPWRLRVWAAALLAGCGVLLGMAVALQPDGRGLGTHEQFGLAPCGMIAMTGLPCPTCGMTTAFAHTVRGQLVRAFIAQPTGLALALATIVAAIGSAWTLATGRLPPVRIPVLTPYRLLLLLLVLLVGGWAFKLLTGLANGGFGAH